MATQDRRLPIRKPELIKLLTVGDYDPVAGTITCVHQFTWSPKASQGEMWFRDGLRKVFERNLARHSSNFVFPADDGGVLRFDLLSALKQCAEAAGIRDARSLRIHDLRHTFAGRLRREGVPLESIMGLMRHADIRETLIYAPYQPEEGRRAIETLRELADLKPDNESEDAP